MRPFACLALCLLAGCAVPASQPASAICPKIDTYTPAENAAIDRELSALPQQDVLRKVGDEDHRLRAELQACRGEIAK